MSQYRHEISSEESSRIGRFLYLLAGGTVAMALVLLVAFLTSDRWLLLISHESERRFVDRYVTLARNHLLTDSDPVLQRYVEDLTSRLAQQMQMPEDLSITVHVVKGPPNAVATLGGHIFVLEGLLRTLNSENSLAMVLAHELAHCINRDPLRSAGRGMLLEIAFTSAGGANLTGNQLLLKHYSREQERTADREALKALNAHYGHVGGATRLFEVLLNRAQDYAPAGIGQPPELLSTHPALDERIDALLTAARENGWSALPARPYPDEVKEALGSDGPSSKP